MLRDFGYNLEEYKPVQLAQVHKLSVGVCQTSNMCDEGHINKLKYFSADRL